MANTLIITLKIESDAQSFFEEKRKQYFPNYCNYVAAHLTYFHAAPDSSLFVDSLKAQAPQSAILMEANTIEPFNNGMAYAVKNERLQALHSDLQQQFLKQLSGKDKKIWKPHITVQNKVTEFKAQKSYLELAKNFTPFKFKVEGFNAYVYAKQKWEFIFFIPFV